MMEDETRRYARLPCLSMIILQYFLPMGWARQVLHRRISEKERRVCFEQGTTTVVGQRRTSNLTTTMNL